MKFFIVLLCCFSLISTGLSSSEIVPEIVINPTKLPAKGDLALSDLIENIEYIPLQTLDKCLLGRISSFDVSDNYILVYCIQTSQVYLFNRKGKFITLISQKGQGPGEYMYIGNVFLDESRNEIIIHSFGLKDQLLYYDLKGKYLRAKDSSGISIIVDRFNDQFITGDFSHRKEALYTYALYDRNLNLLTQGVKPLTLSHTRSRTSPAASYYWYNNKMYIKETALNDTLYVIENNKFIPYMRIHAGKYEVTPEIREETDAQKFFARSYECAILKAIIETEKYLIYNYRYQEEAYYCYYDKSSRKTYTLQSNKGIPNDYNGGFAFWPDKQRNKTWYTFYNAHQFEEELNKQKKLTPKGPKEAVAGFSNLMEKLDTEDNPVLVIVKLK